MSAEATAKWRTFASRLTCFRVTDWGSPSSDGADLGACEKNQGMNGADVISSRFDDGSERHMVVLDIDHEAWLVKSTTPGHHHLYIQVPGGINWAVYADMLSVMADAGVIGEGYRRASIARGFSAVRLPWVKKPSPGYVFPINNTEPNVWAEDLP